MDNTVMLTKKTFFLIKSSSNSLLLPPNVWYRDYAGAGNVHAVGGAAALVGCLFIGPRIGRYEVNFQYLKIL